jgi:hypothetical protein
LSLEKPYLAAFLNIPRTASETTAAILGLTPIKDDPKPENRIICEHHRMSGYFSKKHDLSNVFTFCFVRNPYDRLVSWYEFHRQTIRNIPDRVSFKDWVMAGLPHHWIEWAVAGKSPLLQSNLTNGIKLDFVGRFENYERDMGILIRELNTLFENNGEFPRFEYRGIRLNKTVRRDTDSYYDSEARARACELLAADFEIFDYKK